MIEVFKAELDKAGFSRKVENEWIVKIAEMLGDKTPRHMAIAIAGYQMSVLANHFQKKLKLGKKNYIPLNSIWFILAKSGAKKTSSVSKIEKAFSKASALINMVRQRNCIERYSKEDCLASKMNPLENALATEPGMIKRLNDFKEEGLGCPTMYVDEIATELESSEDIVANIKLVAQLFDEGNMKSKPLKDTTNQSAEIHGMGMSVLFIGSEFALIEDEKLLHKFQVEFISKLARRSFFVYPETMEALKEYGEIDKFLEDKEIEKNKQERLFDIIMNQAYEVTKKGIKDDNDIVLTSEVNRIYQIYEAYNERLARNEQNEQIILELANRGWKTLKMAGVFAIWDRSNDIKINHFMEAVTLAEMGDKELRRFVVKAERQTHEKIVDHFRDGETKITLHQLIKKKWIRNSKELPDLVSAINSLLTTMEKAEIDDDKSIVFKQFEKRIRASFSVKKVSGDKQSRAKKVAEGYKFKQTKFVNVAKIMADDTSYCVFEFKEGKRKSENVMGTCNFLILDIDEGDMTDEEASNYLIDFKHIICRTSDKKNPYKFRVALALDIEADIERFAWTSMLERVGKYLGLKVDALPKSQIYYGYKDRKPIIELDGVDFPISEIIKTLDVTETKIEKIPKENLPRVFEQRAHLFRWFYESAQYGDETPKGNTNNTIFMLSRNLAERGVGRIMAEKIMIDVINYRDKRPRDNFMQDLWRRMGTYPEWEGQKSVVLGEISQKKANKILNKHKEEASGYE